MRPPARDSSAPARCFKNPASMKALFALAAVLVLLQPPAARAGIPDPFPLVTQRVQSWVDRGYYPGCSVWIARGDQTLYEKNFGNATQDTEVYIASAGKWLSAAAILAVVDEGKLSLDDPAEKWLPEFQGDPKGKATLRQMFSHTSGYPPYQPDNLPPDTYPTTAESVKHLLPLPPAAAPREKFEYGGLAMQVAGRMAEVATGKDWETLFREKIAAPLGMTRTRFTPVDPGHIPMIAGGAVSTLADYRRFLTMVADGGVFEGRRVLSEKAVAEMLAQTFSEFEREARTNLDGIEKIYTEGGQWYAFCFGSALGRRVRPPGSTGPAQDVKAKTHSASG